MESDKYTSLFALVESHLSQTSLKERATNVDDALPPFCPKVVHNGSVSESSLFGPSRRFPLPNLSNNNTEVSSILAEQITNMLKAKERKEQKEKDQLKLDEELKKLKLEDDDYVIDLDKVVQESRKLSAPSQPELIKSASFESLLKLNFMDKNGENYKFLNTHKYLPCTTDMSYILKKKIRKGKCSPFGRVLTSRLRPVAAPYLKEIIEHDIPIFDFSTKSPCDLIKEQLNKKKVTMHCNTYNLVEEFMM